MQAKSKNIHAHLLQQCLANDAKAQMEVYDLYHKAAYVTALRFMKNQMDAEEMMHEAFLTAFDKLSTHDFSSSFGAWLKQIVVRKCIDKLRLNQLSFEDQPNDIPQEEHEEFWEGPSLEQIKKAMEDLSSGYATILNLYLIEGYDHEEIAEVLGISSSTSRSQYTRAKAKLRDRLTELGYGR